jgi:voltage-gated potassium channel
MGTSDRYRGWADDLERMLNDPRARSRHRFDAFITVLILVSTGILLRGVFTGEELPGWLLAIDNGILVLFLIEYLARVAFAKPELPEVLELSKLDWLRYQIRARVMWMLTPMAVIDLLAVSPLFALNEGLKLFRVIRVLRLLRLYRVFVYYDPMGRLGKAFRRNSLLYLLAFSLVLTTVFFGSLSIYVVETNEQQSQINGMFDAVWWTVVTLTTVGYGEIVPVTEVGKIVAICLMFTGFILMAVFAGVMSQTLVGYLLDVREETVRMSSTVNHVVICGWNSRGPLVAEELKHLLPEKNEVIVFAEGNEPANLPDGATFVSGNPSKESELGKVRLSMAKTAIVLAPSGTTLSSADGLTALVVYTLRSYEKKLTSLGVKRVVPLHITAELMNPDNFQHLHVAGADEVVHTALIGCNLVAHSSVKPGIAKIVTELVSWWGHGINIESVPDTYEPGQTFIEMARAMTTDRACLILALLHADGQVRFNPSAEHPVEPGDRLVVIRKDQYKGSRQPQIDSNENSHVGI